MNPLVYYITRSDRPGEVKIGTSKKIFERLSATDIRGKRSEDVQVTLLAVEPGDRWTEAQRHNQFAPMRLTPKGEWFTLGAPIIHHIMELDQVPVPIRGAGDTHRMPIGG